MTEVLLAEIQIGLDDRHKGDLIRLFCDTFPAIIVPVFGSIERCARLLDDSLDFMTRDESASTLGFCSFFAS